MMMMIKNVNGGGRDRLSNVRSKTPFYFEEKTFSVSRYQIAAERLLPWSGSDSRGRPRWRSAPEQKNRSA